MTDIKTIPKMSTRRRTVMKGAAAAATGATAAAYVKPTLTALGVPVAFGASPVSGKCSINIAITDTSVNNAGAGGVITGHFTVTNASSSDGGCPTCQITYAKLFVVVKSTIPNGTGCQSIIGTAGISVVGSVDGAAAGGTGGATPLVTGAFTPTCGATATYSFSVAYTGADVQMTLVLQMDVEPSPQHDSVFNTCTTVDTA